MIKSYKILFFLAFLGLCSQVHAQTKTRSYYADKGLVPRTHSADMQKLSLKISFVPEEGKVIGEVKHDFVVIQQGVDSLFLDAVSMEFESVTLDGKEVKYENRGKGLVLRFSEALAWNSQHQIKINYTAHPKKGIYFIGWKDPSNRSRKQIWTQGQGINNRHWIPMYDEKNDKVISEIEVSFDAAYQVLSNGQKLSEKKGNKGEKIWKYRMSNPHAPYLIMLGIGDYAIKKEKSKSGVPLNLYYYPDQPEQVEPTYRYSLRMFNFFEEEIGVPYPWKSYSQIPVQDFMYGAMENTTATVFGDFYLVDSREYLDKNYVRVDAHELAHQWFGDMITARASAHHWLQESFATHYDLMYQKEAFGQDHFDWTKRDYNNQALAESKKNLKPIAHSSAGSVRHYPKGAFVLQMLKDVVGREQFNAAIKYYLEKHAYGHVNSKDLLVAFHERLGLSLNWFWEEWVYKGGEPSYQVHFTQEEKSGQFEVKQVHAQSELVGLFKMPMDFELHYKSGVKQVKKVWIEKPSHLVRFDLLEGEELAFALFDPNSQVMKKVDFEKSTEMLLLQAENAEHMLDRFDAIQALATRNFPEKAAFLKARFQAESFHGIRAEILAQTLPALDEAAKEMVQLALKDSDSKVRLAALESSLRIPLELEANYRNCLTDSSYRVIEKALELLAFYHPNQVEDYLKLTQNEMGNRSHNVRIRHLIIQVAQQGKEQALSELIDYTGPSFEFLTRVNAANALKELNLLDELALANLLEATCSFNSRLRGPVTKVLDHFFAQQSYKAMMLTYVSNTTWTDREFNRVKKYLIP